jgi:hypothetical protein
MPLINTTAEQFMGKNWGWSSLGNQAFEVLKPRFIIAPVLRHYNPKLPIMQEIVGTNFPIEAMLLQNEGRVQPVAVDSRKMTATELNDDIDDKEILGMISAFNEKTTY